MVLGGFSIKLYLNNMKLVCWVLISQTMFLIYKEVERNFLEEKQEKSCLMFSQVILEMSRTLDKIYLSATLIRLVGKMTV